MRNTHVLKSKWANEHINDADLQSFLADFLERSLHRRVLKLGMPSWVYTDGFKQDCLLGEIVDYNGYILSGIDEPFFSTGYYGVGEPFYNHCDDEMPLGEIIVCSFCMQAADISDVMEGLTQHAAQCETKINPATGAIESKFQDRRGWLIRYVTESTGKTTHICGYESAPSPCDDDKPF
jgi:hypothetical protein